VHEQCPEPLFHDFEIVIVPFLQAFVDPAVQSRGEGDRREERKEKIHLGSSSKVSRPNDADLCLLWHAFVC